MHSSLRKKYIGNAAFYKMALAVAVPIMIQNGITNFVSLLDNIMVGRVGTEQMTGVAIVNQLIFVFNLAIFGAVSGAGIFGAQYYGKGDWDGVRQTFRFKLLVCTALTVLGACIFLLFGEDLILLYLKGDGSPEQIAASLGYAKEYLLIMLVGFIPFTLAQCYSGTLRETGQTVVPMVAGVVSVVVNLCFNTLLIFGYLGFPRLGASGAAIATVIARFVEAGVVMLWAHRNPERVPYLRGVYRSFRIPAALARAIARKSIPLLLNETLWAAGMALLAQCYSVRGYDVVSAYNICSTVSNVFNVAFMAMGNAVGILVGQLLGAGKMEEAVDTDRKLITFSVVICIVLGGLMSLVAHLFPQIYNTSDSIRDLAAAFIRICALCMPINALANACYFTLRSGGKTFVTFLFDSFYVCVLTVPMAFVLRPADRAAVPLLPAGRYRQVRCRPHHDPPRRLDPEHCWKGGGLSEARYPLLSAAWPAAHFPVVFRSAPPSVSAGHALRAVHRRGRSHFSAHLPPRDQYDAARARLPYVLCRHGHHGGGVPRARLLLLYHCLLRPHVRHPR